MTYFLMVFLIMMTFFAQSFAQIGISKSFNFATESTAAGQVFLGNGIVDLTVGEGVVWAATGFGLNKSEDQGQTWQTFESDAYLSKGGISSMAFMDDSTLWIATAFDTSAQEDDLAAGGGLSFTRNGGQTWQHVPQPVDSRDEREYSPTTTTVQNLTFDIAFVDSTIWIASFGGGLRRSDNMGQTWQVVTTDNQPFSSLNILNHRAFSLLSEMGNLWYGSAEGISKSTDNGSTWERFTHQNQENPISGNFVVALAYQDSTNTIWAATVEATDTSETRAVSKTTNGGLTWDVVLEGVFAHNFGFDGETVFVAADLGLFVSDDGGENWSNIPEITDSETGEEILVEEYFSVATQKTSGDTRWWLGNAGGLATTNNRGNSWKVIRSFVSTRERSNPSVYAYPSPFSPSRSGYTRFQYDIEGNTSVEIKIYNFAMEYVATVKENEIASGAADRSAKWDGRDSEGKEVASGVYFFKAKVGSKVSWGKVVVIN
jgi:FlgD Ig-like domain/BNR/Asp-box repeat